MMKNKIAGEIGFLKARRCTMVIDATDWKRGNNGEFIFHEARIVENLSYSEIGRRLGKTRSNIYSIMRYANKKLVGEGN